MGVYDHFLGFLAITRPRRLTVAFDGSPVPDHTGEFVVQAVHRAEHVDLVKR